MDLSDIAPAPGHNLPAHPDAETVEVWLDALAERVTAAIFKLRERGTQLQAACQRAAITDQDSYNRGLTLVRQIREVAQAARLAERVMMSPYQRAEALVRAMVEDWLVPLAGAGGTLGGEGARVSNLCGAWMRAQAGPTKAASAAVPHDYGVRRQERTYWRAEVTDWEDALLHAWEREPGAFRGTVQQVLNREARELKGAGHIPGARMVSAVKDVVT